MRTSIAFLFLFFYSICSTAQKMAEDYYEQGLVAFAKEDYQKAIDENNFLLSHYIKYRNNRPANRVLGLAYMKKGYFDSAVAIFNNLITDTSGYNRRNEKHDIGLLLAATYKAWGKYDSATKYLYLSDTLNFYSNGCGNCTEGEIYKSTYRLIELFETMGDTLLIKKELLKLAVFSPSYSQKFLDKLREIFVREGNVIRLKKEFGTACKNVHNDKNTLSIYGPYIIFQNAKMYLGYEYGRGGDTKTYVQHTSFYKMLMSLPETSVKHKR